MSDDTIWMCVNNTFCSYKVKTETQTFCRHKLNVTGLCSRTSCVLANSRYATIVEHEGKCYLYMKTIERAHSPANLWEKIPLPSNYKEALSIIDEQLQFWPEWVINKCKQRLTKIVQYIIRLRKMHKNSTSQLVGINKKVERREKTRELKALSAAQLERTISKELLTKLQAGEYSDIFNFPQRQYEQLLDDQQLSDQSDLESIPEGFIEDYSDSDEGFSGSDAELPSTLPDQPPSINSDDDIENAPSTQRKRRSAPKSKSRRPRVEIEFEEETLDGELEEVN
ncbi:hypothetical protein P9112_014179 [Eukaryota sp. TZLM1-RC]